MDVIRKAFYQGDQTESEGICLSDMPKDILLYIFQKMLAFHDQYRLSLVNKHFQKMISHDSFGFEAMAACGLVTEEPNSWMPSYGRVLNTPYIIALDTSASMEAKLKGIKRIEWAALQIKQFAAKIIPAIELYGVDCLMFDEQIHHRRCYSLEEMTIFFSKKTASGHGFAQLFDKINQIQLAHLHQAKKLSRQALSTQVLLVSDFDGKYPQLAPSESYNVNFECLCIDPGHQSALFAHDMETEFNSIESTNKKKEGQLKRKRNEISPPFTLTSIFKTPDFTVLEPNSKRRKTK